MATEILSSNPTERYLLQLILPEGNLMTSGYTTYGAAIRRAVINDYPYQILDLLTQRIITSNSGRENFLRFNHDDLYFWLIYCCGYEYLRFMPFERFDVVLRVIQLQYTAEFTHNGSLHQIPCRNLVEAHDYRYYVLYKENDSLEEMYQRIPCDIYEYDSSCGKKTQYTTSASFVIVSNSYELEIPFDPEEFNWKKEGF